MKIRLADTQKKVYKQVALDGVSEAYRHIYMLTKLSKQGKHYTRVYCRGMWITLGMAIKRRRRCIKLFKNIQRGILEL